MTKGHKKLLALPANFAESGLMLFMREIALNPSAMGAACPSSKHLAQRIAAQVPHRPGLVIELGGGTGVITDALLKRGISADDLIVIERSESLAQHLQERFPQLQIIHGDARSLKHLLGTSHPPINAVVSGLPLRSLPDSVVQVIGTQLESVLTNDALYIQFTYSLYRAPFSPSAQLSCVHKEYIWRNLPPARVDVFRYTR